MIGSVRYGTVLVDGPSMLPVLRTGDCLLVAYGGRVRPGNLVIARPWTRPELLVVKRAVEQVAGGWLVESDNAAVRGQGWTGGEADVVARVVLRYWPPGRRASAGRG